MTSDVITLDQGKILNDIEKIVTILKEITFIFENPWVKKYKPNWARNLRIFCSSLE